MKYSETGTVAYFGDVNWTNYTFTVDATKLIGDEGFLIPFAVKDTNTNYFWNIGGWGNTLSCLQILNNGAKTGQVAGTVKPVKIENDETYSIRVEVNGTVAKGYINDELYFEYDADTTNANAYQVVSTDESGDIIVKLVNVSGVAQSFAVDVTGAEHISDTAKVYQVAGNSLEDDNIFGQPEACTLNEFSVSGFSNQFNYTVPKYSVTIIRIPTGE